MFLYLVGATMLALNVLSFAAHHVVTFGPAAFPGVYLHAALFLWFVVEYLVFERVHLYTYDLFAERVGFKLGWGCFTFYPYFYAVGLWAVADLPAPILADVAARALRGSCSSRAGSCRAARICRSTCSRPRPTARCSAS